MFTLLCYFSTSLCPVAEDTTVADSATTQEVPTATVITQVRVLQEQAEARGKQLEAVEHYLADRDLVDAGKAPRGWVQPPLYKYAGDEAPMSFIPVPTQP